MPDIAAFHPQIVHFAVALLLVGVLLRWISLTGRLAFTGPAAVTLLLLGTLATFAAFESGHQAHGPVERIPGVGQAVHEHEEWGERTRTVFAGVAVLELIGLALLWKTNRFAKAALVLSAVVGLGGVFVLVEAAEHGGDLVYSYAGGPGLRTGEPGDVENLFVAGVYEQAMQDRKAGRHDEAAELVDLAARRFPDDPDWQLLSAESMIDDRDDPEAALARLDAIDVSPDDRRTSVRVALLRADAHQEAGDPAAARREARESQDQVPRQPVRRPRRRPPARGAGRAAPVRGARGLRARPVHPVRGRRRVSPRPHDPRPAADRSAAEAHPPRVLAGSASPRLAAALGAILAVGLCASWSCSLLVPPARVPMAQKVLRETPASGCAAILLPGRWDRVERFEEAGFPERAERAGVDLGLIEADAHIGYYRERSVVPRLEQDVIGPARARGARHVWMVGTSLGGIGSLVYWDAHPDQVAGLVLIAPYLGEDEALDEIRRAGSLRAWQPPADVAGDDVGHRVWRILRKLLTSESAPPVVLAFGTGDDLAPGHRLLARELPADRVFERPGGHDWDTWAALWSDVLASGEVCATGGAAP